MVVLVYVKDARVVARVAAPVAQDVLVLVKAAVAVALVVLVLVILLVLEDVRVALVVLVLVKMAVEDVAVNVKEKDALAIVQAAVVLYLL